MGVVLEDVSSPIRHTSPGGTALLGLVTVPVSPFCSLSLTGCQDLL